MSVSNPSSIHPFFMFKPRHHAFPNASSSKRETALLPNDDVLPTASIFTECFEENLLSNGALLPTSAHRSVSSPYQFLMLTYAPSITESVQHSFFLPSNRWSFCSDPNPSSSIFQAPIFKWRTKTKFFR
jgi:hypothetical protein